jgi:hypothetical protein
MAKRIPPVNYHSGAGDVITVSKTYVYKIEIYKYGKNSFNLESSSIMSVVDNTNIQLRSVSKLESGEIIVKELELIGAPEEYLIQNNYIKNEN